MAKKLPHAAFLARQCILLHSGLHLATCARHHNDSQERGWRCAMQLVKKVVGVKKSLPLAEACALYGLPGGTHRAGADVEATYHLLNALKNSICD